MVVLRRYLNRRLASSATIALMTALVPLHASAQADSIEATERHIQQLEGEL